jgi:hypothetical protein
LVFERQMTIINQNIRATETLKPVLQKEAEIKRRAARNPLQPPGDLNTFNSAHRNIHGLIQQYREEPSAFTQEEFCI